MAAYAVQTSRVNIWNGIGGRLTPCRLVWISQTDAGQILGQVSCGSAFLRHVPWKFRYARASRNGPCVGRSLHMRAASWPVAGVPRLRRAVIILKRAKAEGLAASALCRSACIIAFTTSLLRPDLKCSGCHSLLCLSWQAGITGS